MTEVGERAIFAEDLAVLMGTSVSAARRMLKFLRKKYGTRVVGEAPGRNGERLWATYRSISGVMPSLTRAGKDIYDRVDRLEREVCLLKQRKTPQSE